MKTMATVRRDAAGLQVRVEMGMGVAVAKQCCWEESAEDDPLHTRDKQAVLSARNRSCTGYPRCVPLKERA
jgi:hypothetical protein